MYNYILWDLDGTVVESEDIIFKTKMFNHASKEFDLSFDLKPNEYIGREAKSIFDLVLVRNKITDKKGYIAIYDAWYEEAVNFIKENVALVPPRKNVVALWKKANENGIRNAIVTSSREDIARTYLKNIGLAELCSHYTCINHVSKSKPNPEPYLLATRKLSSSNKHCIVVEDSQSGINSAKSANLYTIAWVEDTLNNAYSKADKILGDLTFQVILEGFEKAKNYN